jgi:drug/metabolite transporter (DMT)-like permease
MTVLAQTENVFAPFWVFLRFSERPGWQTILGGAIILAAVVGKAVIDNRRAPVPFPHAE